MQRTLHWKKIQKRIIPGGKSPELRTGKQTIWLPRTQNLEAGSYIFDKTKSLIGIFRDGYRFDTEYFFNTFYKRKIESPDVLTIDIADLSDQLQVALNKKVLLVLYYNGHVVSPISLHYLLT